MSAGSAIRDLCNGRARELVQELIRECALLRSDWAVVAEGGRGLILSLSYAEDEPLIDKLTPVVVFPAEEGWEAIREITDFCPSPRLIKRGDVVIGICEEREPSIEELEDLICNLKEPVVLCTNEWA